MNLMGHIFFQKPERENLPGRLIEREMNGSKITIYDKSFVIFHGGDFKQRKGKGTKNFVL